MNTKSFDSLMKGAREALAFAKGNKSIGKATVIKVDDLDVAKIRGKVKLPRTPSPPPSASGPRR